MVLISLNSLLNSIQPPSHRDKPSGLPGCPGRMTPPNKVRRGNLILHILFCNSKIIIRTWFLLPVRLESSGRANQFLTFWLGEPVPGNREVPRLAGGGGSYNFGFALIPAMKSSTGVSGFVSETNSMPSNSYHEKSAQYR